MDEAEALIEDRLPIIHATGFLDNVLTCYTVLVRIAQQRSNIERAYALLEQGENLGYERQWDRLIAAAVMERVRLYLSEGRLAEASACLMRLDRLAAACPCPTPCAWSDIHRYRALGFIYLALAQNRFEDAIAALNTLLREVEDGPSKYFGLRLRLLLATVLLGANEPGSAVETFNAALSVAVTAGVFQSFPDLQRPEMGSLLLQARQDAERTQAKDKLAYIDRLLTAWRSYHQVEHRQDDDGSVEPLSSRERNVLDLIAEGQSNKEIARALGIAPETVKSHVKNIFAKLAVEKRAHAVARAQALGLVKGK